MMEGKAGKRGWGNKKEEGIASLNYANVCRTRRMTPNNKQGREKGRKKKKKKGGGKARAGEWEKVLHVVTSRLPSRVTSVSLVATISRFPFNFVPSRPAVGRWPVFPVSATSSCRHGNCVPHLVVLVVVVVTADKLVQRGEEGGREERP